MSRAAVAVALLIACSCGAGALPTTLPLARSVRLDRVDIVIFAPHPDDEVIGAGGVMQMSLERGDRVRIVFATNGDGYAQAASTLLHKPVASLGRADYLRLAAARQREAMAADALLGLHSSDLVFLGYPDSVLAEVNSGTHGDPVRSPTTARATTYGPVGTDYHTLAHGRPAPYTRAAALGDIEELLAASRPALVYVTDPADQHPDHHAVHALVRDAIAALGLRTSLLGYVVHSGPGWPWPIGPTPGSPFGSRTIGGTTYPIGLPWPPPIRVPLTTAQATLKLRAIDANQSQLGSPIERLYLESFVKSEEVFWPLRA